MSDYHTKHCALAKDHFKNHTLQAVSPASLYDRELWRIHDATNNWSHAVEIQAVGFGRLLVHGSCEPMVFGNYTQEVFRYHPLIHEIGTRDEKYLGYIAGKTLPKMPDYYDQDAMQDCFDALRAALQEEGAMDEEVELDLANIQDAINDENLPRVQTLLYEHNFCEPEDISRFGQVLAPPNFYYAVFAVKKLWELLEVHNDVG
jgi:hypothetical protein